MQTGHVDVGHRGAFPPLDHVGDYLVTAAVQALGPQVVVELNRCYGDSIPTGTMEYDRNCFY